MTAAGEPTPIEALVATISAAFAPVRHPGDAFLQGSFDGCEPAEAVAEFAGVTDWRTLGGDFLDANYTALSFLSAGGLRFFLPAYLVADVNDELWTADPEFHLTHGFLQSTVEVTGLDGRTIRHTSGGDTLLGPRRFGALTWAESTRHRLSVFAREEAVAIVDYLRWAASADGTRAKRVGAALERFWLERAATAPTQAELAAFGTNTGD